MPIREDSIVAVGRSGQAEERAPRRDVVSVQLDVPLAMPRTEGCSAISKRSGSTAGMTPTSPDSDYALWVSTTPSSPKNARRVRPRRRTPSQWGCVGRLSAPTPAVQISANYDGTQTARALIASVNSPLP
jgi:hypothetical protein